MKCSIDSLYICVDDLERAVAFYEDFFEQKIKDKTSLGGHFDIHGFRFHLFAYKEVHEAHSYGSNCLPSVCFENLATLKNKISGKEICFPLTKIGKNWVAEFVDSEGNHIEVYTKIQDAADSAQKNPEHSKLELLGNLQKIHTTEMGAERIRRNLSLSGETDVVEWCKNKIEEKDTSISRNGKNWYIESSGCIITVNAYSFTIITAHKGGQNA